jgi:hypothetical protein
LESALVLHGAKIAAGKAVPAALAAFRAAESRAAKAAE